MQPPAQFMREKSMVFGIEARIGYITLTEFIASFSLRLLVIILQYFFLSCSSYLPSYSSYFATLLFSFPLYSLLPAQFYTLDQTWIVVSRVFTFQKTAVVFITDVNLSSYRL
jgi:hypothetical protein